MFGYPYIISGTGKATDFKVGGYIYRANPNKSPLKILEKRELGRIQGLPKFLGYPLLSQERAKLRTSNFVGTFIVAVGVFRESREFRAPIYRAHRAVIFATAHLFCSIRSTTTGGLHSLHVLPVAICSCRLDAVTSLLLGN